MAQDPYDPTDEEKATGRGLSVDKLRAVQSAHSLSNRKISELSEGQLASLLRKLALGDRARMRAEYQGLFERGAESSESAGYKMRALNQLAESRAKATEESVAGVPAGKLKDPAALSPPPLAPPGDEPELAGLAPTGAGWTSLGPGGVGGRTRTIVVDPGNPDRIFAGSVGGGVWITRDGGASWHPVDDRMANLAVTSIVMDPNNSNVLYAGTGEGFHNLDAIRGAGIFRTINGVAWDQLAATDTADFLWVNRLALSPDGTTLLAATRTGLHRSEDPDHATWTRIESGNFTDVCFHPSDGRRAVAATGSRSGDAFFTTDGGRSWSRAAGITGHGRVEVTYAVGNPDVVYASVDLNQGTIFRSTDGGASYSPRASHNSNGFAAQYLGQQGWYDNVIWAGDPTDVDLVVVGGIDLWRSTDGGDNLTRISNWTEDASAHADHHAIVSHPGYNGGSNTTVFFGNDGGIYRAADVTSVGNDPDQVNGWTSLVNGYAVTQFYGAAGNPATGTIIGGAQDNGTLSFVPASGVNAWSEILGGDGGYCGADPTNANIFYQEYVNLDIHRNDNGATSAGDWWLNYISGSFFNLASGDWDRKPIPFQIPDAGTNDALFIAPFAVDPNVGARILAGGSSLWRTNDAHAPNTNTSGPRWASIKPSIATSGQRNRISAVCIADGDSDVVWVGYEGGEVFRSQDATSAAPTWTRVDGNGPLPGRFCTRLVIDPGDHERVYATFAGYAPGNIWRTDDGGASWQDLSATVPDAPGRCLAIHPRRPTFLYYGTELGILTSEDQGANWSPTNEGPTNCPITDLIWMGETLVCATHGRGMFSIDLSGIPGAP